MEEVMKHGISVRKSLMGIILALATVLLTSGCATKKYVRTEVDSSTHQLSARIDNNEQAIKSSQNEIEELNGLTRDQSQKIAVLDNGVKQIDSKAQQALNTGEAAQNTANKAVNQVSTLENKFQNRNHYAVLNEEQVRFKFNSAKLDPSFKKVLDDLAHQIKQNPDVILIMEGRTDATGPRDYNIELGQKRLQAVIRYLVVEQEVPMNRISQLSFGADRPIAANKTKEGRAQNRSVVLRVMGPELAGKEGIVSQVGEPSL
jgi:outer membrane protein OmpA-like peptidoglycan-associated protein